MNGFFFFFLLSHFLLLYVSQRAFSSIAFFPFYFATIKRKIKEGATVLLVFILLVYNIILKFGYKESCHFNISTLFPQPDNYGKWPLLLSHWSVIFLTIIFAEFVHR